MNGKGTVSLACKVKYIPSSNTYNKTILGLFSMEFSRITGNKKECGKTNFMPLFEDFTLLSRYETHSHTAYTHAE